MIVKVEQYQDKVYILDATGRIWRFTIGFDRQPEVMQLIVQLTPDHIERLMNYRPLSGYDSL